MPDLPVHLIVPLLALLIVSGKEHHRHILLLLPLAIVPDLDTFVTQHRALLHNMFIPLILLLFALVIKEKRAIFIIASAYLASHVLLDVFGGGAVLFYPLYNGMAFIEASLQMSHAYEISWTFDYGFKHYDKGWETAYGYISDSIGTGSVLFVLLAGACIAYRNWRKLR